MSKSPLIHVSSSLSPFLTLFPNIWLIIVVSHHSHGSVDKSFIFSTELYICTLMKSYGSSFGRNSTFCHFKAVLLLLLGTLFLGVAAKSWCHTQPKDSLFRTTSWSPHLNIRKILLFNRLDLLSDVMWWDTDITTNYNNINTM